MYIWTNDFIIPFDSVKLVQFHRDIYLIPDGELIKSLEDIEEDVSITIHLASSLKPTIHLEGDDMTNFLNAYKEYLVFKNNLLKLKTLDGELAPL